MRSRLSSRGGGTWVPVLSRRGFLRRASRAVGLALCGSMLRLLPELAAPMPEAQSFVPDTAGGFLVPEEFVAELTALLGPGLVYSPIIKPATVTGRITVAHA